MDIKNETRVDENNLMVPFYCVVRKVCKKCEKIEFKKIRIIRLKNKTNWNVAVCANLLRVTML